MNCKITPKRLKTKTKQWRKNDWHALVAIKKTTWYELNHDKRVLRQAFRLIFLGCTYVVRILKMMRNKTFHHEHTTKKRAHHHLRWCARCRLSFSSFVPHHKWHEMKSLLSSRHSPSWPSTVRARRCRQEWLLQAGSQSSQCPLSLHVPSLQPSSRRAERLRMCGCEKG